MSRNSVAVLDVRSYEVTVLVGERGVNNTFVFKASHTEPYDGYGETAFFDTDRLTDAIYLAVSSVEKTISARIRKIWVGVPGAFTEAIPAEPRKGFPKKRRITEKERQELFESGKTERKGCRLIASASMLYITADNRRVVDPIGLSSTSLKGLISYVYCTEYFAKTMEKIFKTMRISVAFLPTELAMASYLIPAETRDEYAIFFDVGFLSSTVAVVLGGGIMAQESYFVGKGHIALRVTEEFGVPYEAACLLVDRANLYLKGTPGTVEFEYAGETYEIDYLKLAEVVKDGLDMICEAVSGFLDECTGRELDYKPIYVTGEGLADIRGALEHVSKRVSRVCEMVYPDLPYYNRPQMSSRIALIDMAYEDHRKSGFFHKLFS